MPEILCDYLNRIITISARYKILHLIYWAWAFIGLLHQREERFGDSNHLADVTIITFCQMGAVYTTLYLLIPATLNKGRYVTFFLVTFLIALIAAMLTTAILSLYSVLATGLFISNYIIITISHLIDICIVITVFSAVVVLAQRYQLDRYHKTLERERLETELNFLKAQINPHFLFNALNSIYVLINLDNRRAADALMKFSGLLRYQLYECTEARVPLHRELDCLRDYIGLARIRNEEQLQLRCTFPDDASDIPIAPFILLPLVENAFKHISHFESRRNLVDIKVSVSDDKLWLRITNTYEEQINSGANTGGIGLQNVRRRLQLLYPGKHQLTIRKRCGFHVLELILDEKATELSHSR